MKAADGYTSAATLAFCGFLLAQDKPAVKQVPIKDTPVTSGETMYREYCASCHGLAGLGDGPAAPALKRTPGSLVTLAARNNGKFPSLHVMNVIQGSVGVTAHGSREMPVWGLLFRRIRGEPQLRIRNLVDYIESIQLK